MLATHAAKRGFLPGMLEEGVIAPVIVQPQAEKKPSDQ